jgi:hypothetical protein
MGRYILHLEPDNVAATKLAVDGQVEHREIPDPTLYLKLRPNGPNVLGPQRRLGADNFALIPRNLTALCAIASMFVSSVAEEASMKAQVRFGCDSPLAGGPRTTGSQSGFDPIADFFKAMAT